MKKITIVGAGAIGGFVGYKLAKYTPCEVSAVARGQTLAALRKHGWRYQAQGSSAPDESSPAVTMHSAPVAMATNSPGDLGPQDLVIIAVKAPALPEVLPQIIPLLNDQTLILPAMNGIPWWFSAGLAALGDGPLNSVDPSGRIAAALPLKQIIGCVVHAGTTCPTPGLVAHKMGQGLVIGDAQVGQAEPIAPLLSTPNPTQFPPSANLTNPGAVSLRVERLQQLLETAHFDVTASSNIRQDVWYKLWGNMTMNPISAVTGATVDRILADPLVRNFCSAAMREAAQIGTHLGFRIEQSAEERHALTAKLGAFQTSMLQDVLAKRPIELDAMVGVIHEIGQRIQVPTPSVDALLGLTRLFAQQHGLYTSRS